MLRREQRRELDVGQRGQHQRGQSSVTGDGGLMRHDTDPPAPHRRMSNYGIVANELMETQVAERVVVWRAGGDTIQSSYGTNCVGVLGSEAVLVIAPLISPGLARRVEAALRRLTNAPVRFVVLTHHHTDHTWGASIFSSQGAAVVAHRACHERMAEQHPAILESRRRQPELADLLADTVLGLPA